MKKINIIFSGILCSSLPVQAQSVWNNISLVGNEAKILSIPAIREPLINYSAFETKEGKINVYLPPLSSSVTLSGTVYSEPNGRNGKDSSKNLEALKSYLLKLGDILIKAEGSSFSFQLPAASPSGVPLQLQSSAGQVINTQTLPFTQATVPARNFSVPPYMVSTDAATIKGNFDGNITNTSVTANGQKATLLAESPSRLYIKTPDNITGPVTIQCNEGGSTQKASTNIISLQLSADKTNLRKGESTQIHIKVAGLEGLSTNVPVNITNASQSVINIEGGNAQQIVIVPSRDAASGVYETTRAIQSLKNGGFSVTVNVIPFSAARQ
ncbi:MAG: hypothetical protein HZB42_14415 [Sphingobacteriales bacterium]|nr:hypothetical protein [Sphingobacteriales bacterium]